MLYLNYKKYGTGKTLIIIHGFLGSLDNWQTLATEWGRNGFEVYALDMRNHGRSPHTNEHSVSLMVDDVNSFLDQQKIAKADFLGHSMGGKIVMEFALKFPEKVNRLIVADMAPKAYSRGHDDVFNAINKIDITTISSRKDADEKIQPYLPDYATRQFILKNLDRDDNGNYSWKFNFKVLEKNYDDMILPVKSENEFLGETLFLRGGLSNYISENDHELIKKYFPNSKIETIENAGHWLHADKPKEFSESVLRFLN